MDAVKTLFRDAMTTSPLTYDVLLDHGNADRIVARDFMNRLIRAGLRPRLVEWQAEDRKSRIRACRIAVRIIGRSGALDAPPDSKVTVLAPECSLSPRGLSESFIVDFRRGFDSPRGWQRFDEYLTSAAVAGEWDSKRRLKPAALKRMVIDSYDAIAEKFAAQWFEHPPVNALEKFVRWLPQHALVLDAGCGPGHHSLFLSRCGHEVVGVDLSKAMLRIARSAVSTAAFRHMDIQALKFRQRTFDGIWCAGAAMHVPREEFVALCRGYRAVVRPRGVIAISVQVMRESELVEYGSDRRFFEYYRDKAEIAQLVMQAGLVPVDFDYGETKRNTHGLDLTLKWMTVYAMRGDG
jgi:SAM-dependent methyltransferase